MEKEMPFSQKGTANDRLVMTTWLFETKNDMQRISKQYTPIHAKSLLQLKEKQIK